MVFIFSVELCYHVIESMEGFKKWMKPVYLNLSVEISGEC